MPTAITAAALTAAGHDTAEAREAFTRLAAEYGAIDPDQPGRRGANREARRRKHQAIDRVLDEAAAAGRQR